MADIVNVFLEGPGPFGFRLYGGRGDPLIISKIRVGSKAFEADIREGDVVKSINGQDCSELTQSAAMSMIDSSDQSLSLDIVRNDRAGPGTVVSKNVKKVQPMSAPKSTSSDFVDFRQFNSLPTHATNNDYSRREQTSRDGNTASRTITETEQYGGTTLTRVTRERTSEWNGWDGEFGRSNIASPREEVFRTTSAGFRSNDKIPPHPENVTVDLGRPEERNFGSNYNILTTDRKSSGRSAAWTPGQDSSSWSGSHGTSKRDNSFWSNDYGRPGRENSGWGGNPESLTVDVSPAGIQHRTHSATVSPLSTSRKSVWTPSKHEQYPRTYDVDNNKFDAQYPSSNTNSFYLENLDARSSSRQLADDPFTSESILFKWNSGGEQLSHSQNSGREVFRTTSAKVKREPTPVTFDIGRPPLDESKENYAPNTNFASGRNQQKPWNSSTNDINPMSWEFDVTSSRDSTLDNRSSSQRNTPFNANSMSNESTWKPSGVSSAPQRSVHSSYSDVGGPSSSSRSMLSPRMLKFDSDKGFVDPMALDDLDALANVGLEFERKSTRASTNRKMNFPDLPPDINKILSAPKDVVEDPASVIAQQRIKDDGTMQEKKVYGDSSFYADSKHNYPTVEEQVKMARIVAHSLTSDANANARGHQMFLKRKERADKYAVDSVAVEKKPAIQFPECSMDNDPYYNPEPWNPAKSWRPDDTDYLSHPSSIPPPPPLPTSLLFAPRGEDKSKALSADEFERVRLYDQKSKHDTVSPQVCFNLARDLRENKGKGGRMFAKRRARAEQYTVEGQGHGPDPSLVMKLVTGHARDNPPQSRSDVQINSLSNANVQSSGDLDYTGSVPVNRLKQMIEMPKAKITPWDAMAEYGNIDPAFEHLKDIQFYGQKPGAQNLSSSIQTKMMTDYNGSSSGPPSWARNTNCSINSTDFSSRTNTTTNFTPTIAFNSKSNSGYRPVQFSKSFSNHTGPGITANSAAYGFSEF